jgi:mRNA deadenylase 3'-5' endonuclease subunit Ccr4
MEMEVPLVSRSSDDRANVAFSVISYNILAQAYTRAESFPYAKKEILKQNHRRASLLNQLTALDADICCLQV